jgi:DUF2914 family protein/tetratricopeptide repeat protein
MPETHELRSAVEAANQAASGGDYVTAELKLREAAALQEAQLGPFHADLANTLNNLGVVYERADSPAEAELCYRRAYAIATKALEPSHPFVATSRKNLEDFCKARGRPFDRSTIAPERVPLRKPVRRAPRAIVVGAVGAVGFAMLVLAAIWVRSSDPSDSATTSYTNTSPQPLAPTPAAVPVEPEREPQKITSARSTPRESRAPAASAPAIVTIAEAQLCRRLSTRDWRCEQVSSPVTPGLLFFYTRVNASNNTTVEHRWYRDDRLSQSVELRIQANAGSGYRTYSRRTVSAENAGNWRVEVRTKDGSLVHEERFVVR